MNGYILVGGRSTRMGESKVDLFLEPVAREARQVFDEVFAVHRPGGADVGVVPTIREEPHEEEAPVFGVVRALQHARAKCFVLAVDYPRITSGVLRDLASRFEACAAPLLVPYWDGQPQLLCAGYAAEILPVIEARIERGALDLRGLMTAAEIVEERDLRARHAGEPLRNVNTPGELEALGERT